MRKVRKLIEPTRKNADQELREQIAASKRELDEVLKNGKP